MHNSETYLHGSISIDIHVKLCKHLQKFSIHLTTHGNFYLRLTGSICWKFYSWHSYAIIVEVLAELWGVAIADVVLLDIEGSVDYYKFVYI